MQSGLLCKKVICDSVHTLVPKKALEFVLGINSSHRGTRIEYGVLLMTGALCIRSVHDRHAQADSMLCQEFLFN